MCKAVEEVKIVVDFLSAIAQSHAPSKTSRMEQVGPSILVSLIMVQVSKTIVKFGILESNLGFQDTNHLIIYFSSMHMNEVYAIQNIVNDERRLR